MSHSIAQSKENLIKVCFSLPKKIKSGASMRREAHSDHCDSGQYDLSIDCSIRGIRVESKSGLLSRVTYPLSQGLKSKDALHYAEVINYLLVHSQVFVVQNIDSDRRYSLQMDTLLSAPYNRRSLSHFLDSIAQDISVLIQYCQSKAKESKAEKTKETRETKAQASQNERENSTESTVIPFQPRQVSAKHLAP